MTENRVLSDEQRDSIEKRAHILYSQGDKKLVEAAISDTEQAVLQSPQVLQWRKDAERYQYLRDECNEYEVFEALFEEPPHRWDDKVDALRERNT